MNLDLQLIGDIVESETMRHLELGTWTALSRRVGLSRSTLNRVRIGERVDERRYAKLETALDLPPDTLRTAGLHDVTGLLEIGAPSRIITAVRKHVGTPGEGKESVKRRATGT